MSDVSKIMTSDGSIYNIKDDTSRQYISNRMTYKDIGTFDAEAGLITALNTELDSMSNYTQQAIKFAFSSAAGAFAQRSYAGTLIRGASVSAASMYAAVLSSSAETHIVSGSKATNWIFENVYNKLVNVDVSTSITDLDSIPVNTAGRISLHESVSPKEVTQAYNYICVGSANYRTLTVWYTTQESKKWQAMKNSTTWSSWYSDNDEITTKISNAIYNGLDKTEAGFALDARAGARIFNKVEHIDASTAVTNLDSIPVNSKGRIKLNSTVSPTSATATFNYECVGSENYRSLTLWDTSNADQRWQSTKNGSSASWSAWYSEHNAISEKVSGPSSVVSGTLPQYDGTSGKVLKAGKTITDVTTSTAIANNSNIPTNRTIYNAIYNGLNKTATGFALDASQGKVLSDKIGNLQHYNTTCPKNGGTLLMSCSNTTGSVWLIFVARGLIANDMGAWFAVIGGTSALIKPLSDIGANLTLAFDSTANQLKLTNGDTSNDVLVSAIRLYGTGTMTFT